jgi:alpha-amylase/alpha-mannosidase (GH57 family)
MEFWQSTRQKPSLYLNLIWHQHQPLYLDPATDQLQAPWVRTHATKDYYSMASLVSEFPDIHCTINLTPVLLFQLQDYYVRRLGPCTDAKSGRMRKDAFLDQNEGKTDPWIDLTLKDTSSFNQKDRDNLLNGPWNAWSISDVTMRRFPDYQELKARGMKDPQSLTTDDLRTIKFLFLLVTFDPMFLEDRVRLPDGSTVDVGGFVERKEDGTFGLNKKISEQDCERLIVEAFKIMANVVSLHRSLMYRGRSHRDRNQKYSGQIELTTTPFFHPTLPLIFDSDVARVCHPGSALPKTFRFPQDAEFQVQSGLEYFKSLFGVASKGLWPAEGAVSQEILPLLARNGVKWIATDERILALSQPQGQPKHLPYMLPDEQQRGDGVAIFFRDTELSDKIGFVYKEFEPQAAVDDFVQTLLRYSPKEGETDRIVSVILDGENAWEWYEHDREGRSFLRALYRRLSELYRERRVITVTPTEYLEGNPKRGVSPHPPRSLPVIRKLWPGSWINASYDTWIGSPQKNLGWDLLRRAREALEETGIRRPRSLPNSTREGSRKWHEVNAWQALYAAEGSDWFWWMGSEQESRDGAGPMTSLFVKQLEAVYRHANSAGAKLSVPDFQRLLGRREGNAATIGTMRRTDVDLVTVKFQCDARHVQVRDAIFIVGNRPALGDWIPNRVRMYDDGTHGDDRAGDGIWTIELTFPVGSEILYKFTNSGRKGEWNPGEELPALNRRIKIESSTTNRIGLLDVFGKL